MGCNLNVLCQVWGGGSGGGGQGFFRIIENQGGGGDPSPKTPSCPPQTKVTIVGKNEILLPSAVHLEERLTVSQSVPEPASRQSQIHTVWVFCQWQMRRQAAGRPDVAIQVVAEW